MKLFMTITAIAAMGLTACAGAANDQSDITEPKNLCPIMDAKDLNLWINAMPGPSGPKLIAMFKGTLPTPGYRFKSTVTEIMESDPPIYTIDIKAKAPLGIVAQVLTPTDIRIDVPIQSKEARSVTLTCGDTELFTVTDVETAH